MSDELNIQRTAKKDLQSGKIAGGSGSGTVTSVGLEMPVGFSVANSPVDTSGVLIVSTTLNGILAADGANTIFAIIVGEGLSYDGTTLTSDSITGDITWSVLDILNTPPVSPTTGDIYLVGTSPTGAFAGHANEIAEWNGASWIFSVASIGDLLQNDANSIVYKFIGSSWVQVGKAPLLAGGNTGLTNLRGGTFDNRQFSIITHNIKRMNFAANGTITFNQLTGATDGLMGLSTIGVASNVQIGTGLSLSGGTLSATGFVSSTLTNTHIFVGNASNVATDVAASGDLTLANTGVFTFNTVNSNVGTFGSASQVGQFTVNAKGLITAASNVSITGFASSTLTSAHIFVGNVSNVATDIAASGDLTLANTGAFTFNTVNSNVGTFGSTTQVAQVTVNAKGLVTAVSNITITAPTPSLTSTQIAFGDGSNLMTSSANLTYASNNIASLGGTIGATIVDGFELTSTETAANLAQKWSPAIRQRAFGWMSNSGLSRAVDVAIYTESVQGTTNPSLTLHFGGQINAGGYGDMATISTGANGGNPNTTATLTCQNFTAAGTGQFATAKVTFLNPISSTISISNAVAEGLITINGLISSTNIHGFLFQRGGTQTAHNIFEINRNQAAGQGTATFTNAATTVTFTNALEFLRAGDTFVVNANTYTVTSISGTTVTFTPGFASATAAYSISSINAGGIVNVLSVGDNGIVRIGVGSWTSQGALLQIGAGTAGTGSLNLTSGTLKTTAASGDIEYDNNFQMTQSDATRRFCVLATNATKTTAGAPYTNDGYITIRIGATDVKVMTTA